MKKRLALGILFIALILVTLLVGGTLLMNNMLAEFFPNGPQPSIVAWATFWLSVFIIRNSGLNVDFDTIRFWVSGHKALEPELEELRSLRQEFRSVTSWIDREKDASDDDPRTTG